MSTTLLETINDRPLVSDGAMGTQLMLVGLETGACGEAWNLDHPDLVIEIQRRYVAAGSDCLITNTFGACRLTLARHGQADRVTDINRAAVDNARRAFDSSAGFVLGDLGPTGRILKPLGDAEPDEVYEAFLEQSRALTDAGADAIILETFTALEELDLAIRAARDSDAPCVIACMSFDAVKNGAYRTMMGVSPEQAAEYMHRRDADIIGLNCGTGVDMTSSAEIVRGFRTRTSLRLIAQPNAGRPELVDGKTVYRETPEEMAAAVPALLDHGVCIVGSCCGTAPEHIAAIRRAVDGYLSR